MARTITYVPTAPDHGSVATIPAAEIPQDVIDEVEEIYTALKKNPDGRMRAAFETVAELNQYRTQVMSYCRQRTVDGVAAPLRFRKSPTKNLPETSMDFRIGDPQPEKDAPATPATPAVTPAPVEPTAPTVGPAKAAAGKARK